MVPKNSVTLATVGHQQVNLAAAVEVTERDSFGTNGLRIIDHRRLQRAVPVAQHYSYYAVPVSCTSGSKTGIHHQDVELTVPVDVGNCDRNGFLSTRVIQDRRTKGTVAIAF